MIHSLPELPYSPDALAPAISQETIEFHYGKHFQTYIDNLNKLIEGSPYEDMEIGQIVMKAGGAIFNNAAQAWNHNFYFQTLTPVPAAVPELLEEKLVKTFGSEDFRFSGRFQDRVHQGCSHRFRVRMGMAVRRQGRESVHSADTEC